MLGLLLLALIIWLIWAWVGDDEVEPVATEPITEETTPEPVAEAPAVTIGDVLSNPDDYVGETWPRAEVNVASVPTDRGFWIVDQGDSLFSVIIDVPEEQPKDINPGATLRIDEGTLRDRTYLPEMPGAPLDQTTENIAEQQDAFLVVDERYINVLEGGTPQPGTDPAQNIQ